MKLNQLNCYLCPKFWVNKVRVIFSLYGQDLTMCNSWLVMLDLFHGRHKPLILDQHFYCKNQ